MQTLSLSFLSIWSAVGLSQQFLGHSKVPTSESAIRKTKFQWLIYIAQFPKEIGSGRFDFF